MKKTIVLILSVYMIAFSACKKKSPAPSIIGTWKFTNITGMMIYNNNPGSYDTLTYAYSSADSVYTLTESGAEPFIHDTATYTVNTEAWSFNASGAYTITESYTQGSPAVTSANTATGTWDYLSNTHTNDGIILTGATSSLIPNVSKDNNTYTIQSLTSNTLILTIINTQTSTTGTISYNNVVITFAKG